MKSTHRKAAAAKRIWQKDYNAASRLLNRATGYSPQELEEKKKPIRDSFAAIKNGTGDWVDFANLDIAIGTTMECGRDIDEFVIISAIVARDALERTWNRYQRTNRWGFDGPALTSIEYAIVLHEKILAESTPLQMMAAARKVKRVVSVDELEASAMQRAA